MLSATHASKSARCPQDSSKRDCWRSFNVSVPTWKQAAERRLSIDSHTVDFWFMRLVSLLKDSLEKLSKTGTTRVAAVPSCSFFVVYNSQCARAQFKCSLLCLHELHYYRASIVDSSTSGPRLCTAPSAKHVEFGHLLFVLWQHDSNIDTGGDFQALGHMDQVVPLHSGIDQVWVQS